MTYHNMLMICYNMSIMSYNMLMIYYNILVMYYNMLMMHYNKQNFVVLQLIYVFAESRIACAINNQ